MKARLISVLLVIALLVTVGVVAAQAAALGSSPSKDDLNKAVANSQGQTLTVNPDGTATGLCYVCDPENGVETTWTALPEITTAYALTPNLDATTHYYVQDNLNNSASYKVGGKSRKAHVHLNGNTISSSTIAFNLTGDTSTSVLYIMGDGKVTSTSSEATFKTVAGCLALIGGDYENTGSGAVVMNSATGETARTRRVYIAEGVNVKGTITYSGGGTLYVYGGTIDKIVTPIKCPNYTNYVTIDGNVTIKSLDTSNGYFSSLFAPASGSKIGVSSLGQFTKEEYTSQEKAEADIYDKTANTGYYYAASNLYEIVAKQGKSKWYLSCEAKSDLPTCEHCNLPIGGWEDLPQGGALAAGHYKVNCDGDTLALNAPLAISDNVCIDLNGKNILNSTGHVFEISEGTVYIVGTGDVTGGAEGAVDAQDASVVRVFSGTLNLKGGTYRHTLDTDMASFYITGGEVNLYEGATITATRVLDDQGNIDAENTVYGFNVYINGGTLNVNGGTISYGTVDLTGLKSNIGGANVLVYDSSTLNMTSGQICNGYIKNEEAAQGGGNIYLRAIESKAFISGGTVSGGYSDMQGGNIQVRLGHLIIKGGTIENGVSETAGGNIHVRNAHSDSTKVDSGIQIQGGTIKNGTSDKGGNLSMAGGSSTRNLAVISGGTFIGGTADTGANMYFDFDNLGKNVQLTGTVNIQDANGTAITLSDDSTLVIDGTLNIQNCKYGVTISGALNLNGTISGGNVRIGKNGAALTLGQDVVANVDLNGHDCSVQLAEGATTATFNGVNNNSAAAGIATLGENVTTGITDGYAVSAWNAATHGGYYNIATEQANEGGKIASYHKLEMAMKNISLRTGDVGLYYTSEIKADETLAAMINSAGVLLGATNEGGEGDMADLMLDAKASDLDKTDGAFRSVGIKNPDLSKVTSVLVKNIFKAGATNNAERGKIRIVGTPYVQFTTGDILVCQDVVDYSMKQFLQEADTKITAQAQLLALKNFCDTWKVDSFDWGLPNIMAVVPAEPEV